ncbi:fimbrial protein [Acinetobacter guillouiae]|uniref:fimbrial protein n=1 Tax=Acinetobacter guillouiae TaxID=106649 RepID=UPI003AF41FFA
MEKLTLPVLGALALSLLCTQVFAVDGTITVNGVVTDQTCTLEGYVYATGLKDIKANLGAIPKSTFKLGEPTIAGYTTYIPMRLRNATGTDNCDLVTSQAFQGIHLSVTLATDLDTTDKTLLVNKAPDASKTNPVFVRISTDDDIIVDFSAPWGTQAKSSYRNNNMHYSAYFFSKTGIVDAQTVQVKINYTLHYN